LKGIKVEGSTACATVAKEFSLRNQKNSLEEPASSMMTASNWKPVMRNTTSEIKV